MQRYKEGMEFGGLGVPYNVELEHFYFTGTSGSGKSALMKLLLKSAYERIGSAAYPNNQIMMLDPKFEQYGFIAESLSRNYKNPESRITLLYPFDSRARWWDIQSDIQTVAHCDMVAKALIPDGGTNTDPLWSEAPRRLASAVLESMMETVPQWDFRDIVTVLSDMDLIRHFVGRLDGHPVAKLLDFGRTSEGFNAQFLTFMSQYRATAACYHHLRTVKKNKGFAIRDFPNSELVYLMGNDPLNETALAPLNRLLLEFAFLTVRASRPPVPLWHPEFPRNIIAIDEVIALGKFNGLHNFFIDARSRGGVGILGFQDLRGLIGVYGEHTTYSLLSQISNYCVLRNEAKAAEEVSDLFGYIETLQESVSSSVNEGESSSTRGRTDSTTSGWTKGSTDTVVRTKVVEAAEIRELPHIVNGEVSAFFKAAHIPQAWQVYYTFDELKEAIFDVEERGAEKYPALISLKPAAQKLLPFSEDDYARLGIQRLEHLIPVTVNGDGGGTNGQSRVFADL